MAGPVAMIHQDRCESGRTGKSRKRRRMGAEEDGTVGGSRPGCTVCSLNFLSGVPKNGAKEGHKSSGTLTDSAGSLNFLSVQLIDFLSADGTIGALPASQMGTPWKTS